MDHLHSIENEFVKVVVNDQGAELWELWNKETKEQVIWDGRPEIWNRRTPILFPFVGRISGNAFHYQGKSWPVGQHGFARDMAFEMKEKGADYVVHELSANKETKAKYPFDFVLRITHRLDKNNLTVAWEVKNGGTGDMYFKIGGHPGFALPEMENGDGVYSLYFPGKDKLTYLLVDLATGLGMPEALHALSLEQGRCPVGRHMFDRDALIFDDGQIGEVSVLRPDGSRYVTMFCEGFESLGIWAKPGAPYVCLEPWSGRCDNTGCTEQLEEKPGLHILRPGDTYRKSYRIAVNGFEKL
jgi:galactose mutarotase-like enzyme